jgi:hypothetical protein
MMRILGAVTVAALFLVVNGGYVYKTQCPLPGGGVTASWTYGINDILPYIRTTSAPCVSHTGTRLALSALSIWPLHSTHQPATSSSNTGTALPATVALTDQQIATRLAALFSSWLPTLSKETAWSKSVTKQQLARADPSIAKNERQFTAESILVEAKLAAMPTSSDVDINTFRNLFLKDLQLRDKVRRIFTADVDVHASLARIGSDIAAPNTASVKVARELAPVLRRLSRRYNAFAPFRGA